MLRIVVAGAMLALAVSGSAWAQVSVDGVYAGQSEPKGGSNGRCPPHFTFKVHVKDRSFLWTLPNKTQVPVPVAPDGSFSAENGKQFLNGKIDGPHLTAETTGPNCSYAWTFMKE